MWVQRSKRISAFMAPMIYAIALRSFNPCLIERVTPRFCLLMYTSVKINDSHGILGPHWRPRQRRNVRKESPRKSQASSIRKPELTAQSSSINGLFCSTLSARINPTKSYWNPTQNILDFLRISSTFSTVLRSLQRRIKVYMSLPT